MKLTSVFMLVFFIQSVQYTYYSYSQGYHLRAYVFLVNLSKSQLDLEMQIAYPFSTLN